MCNTKKLNLYYYSTSFYYYVFYYYFGDNMKVKFIFPIFLAIVIGFLSAKIFYETFEDKSQLKPNSYFIQVGAYVDKTSVNKITKNLKAYLTIEEDGKSYVYVGITSNEKNKEKIKKIYEDKGYSVYVKENYINNTSFYSNLIQYDVLLSEVTNEEDLISISKVILSSYEELV